MSSDVVTFIGLRLLAAVFAVPGRAIGLLKIAEKKYQFDVMQSSLLVGIVAIS
jgi:hypothetical protein